MPSGEFSHQEALTCGAKIAGAFPKHIISIYLHGRGHQHDFNAGKPYGSVSISIGREERAIDELTTMREKVRELGYDAELDIGNLDITRA